AWSLMGFLSAQTNNFQELLVCRTLLGLFEAGHWPCALKTTHLLLSTQDRTMGNSVLQSGASIGAIITPLVMRALMTDVPGTWRLPFQVIGAIGVVWVVAWLAATPSLSSLGGEGQGEEANLHLSNHKSAWSAILHKRFFALLI